MFSSYGKPHTTIILMVGTVAFVATLALKLWLVAAGVLLIIGGLMAFFRDPDRRTPPMRGQAVAPADGRISSIHTVERFEAFDGPAVCIRIFLSIFDVHVNRCPLHGRVASIEHKPGEYLNALKAESAERNESVTTVLRHPTHGYPVAAVRQVAGAIARRIVNDAQEGDILQRGQRFGMIKFGSTTELYLPHPDRVDVQVRQGQYVYGAETVLAHVRPQLDAPLPPALTGEGSTAKPASATTTAAPATVKPAPHGDAADPDEARPAPPADEGGHETDEKAAAEPSEPESPAAAAAETEAQPAPSDDEVKSGEASEPQGNEATDDKPVNDGQTSSQKPPKKRRRKKRRV